MFGGHFCAFCHDEAERARVATVLIREGLAVGERVVCIGGRPTGPFRAAMDAAGLPTDRAVEAGQLITGNRSGGCMEARQLADGIHAAARQTRLDGFPGLRLAVQMSALIGDRPVTDQLRAWEYAVEDLCETDGITVCCEYDLDTVVGHDAETVLGLHRGTVSGRTGEPGAIMLATSAPWGLRVEGELDVSNRDDFADALVARIAVDPRVSLDVSRVSFVDMASLTLLYTVAAELPADGWIRLIGASGSLQRVLAISGFSDPRVIVEPQVDGPVGA